MDEFIHPAKTKNELDFFSKFVGKTVNRGNLYKAIFILVTSFFFLWSMNAAFASDVSTCSTDNNALDQIDEGNCEPSADVSVSKEFWDGSEANKCAHIPVTSANYSSNVWSVVKVTNNGPDMVPTTIVTDNLPVGLVYIAHAIFNGTDHILDNPGAFNPATGQWTINNLMLVLLITWDFTVW